MHLFKVHRSEEQSGIKEVEDFEIDLSKYSGKTVTIILSILLGPKNGNRWDWGLLGRFEVGYELTNSLYNFSYSKASFSFLGSLTIFFS
jgi:hypothetical protein